MKLKACLTEAVNYWKAGSPDSASIMAIRAKRCVDLLGGNLDAGKLTKAHAAKLLAGLANEGLSRKSVQDYYSTFKRMLKLSDADPPKVAQWPSSPKPARKTRDAIDPELYAQVVVWLRDHNFPETADLAIVLFTIGGRIQKEILTPGNLKVKHRGDKITAHITGKGGNERNVPIVGAKVQKILCDPARLNSMLDIPYKTHLWRWNRARNQLGLLGLATPHALRHTFATEALRKSKNLRLVQELLGHSNPATTAIYAHVAEDEKVQALTE